MPRTAGVEPHQATIVRSHPNQGRLMLAVADRYRPRFQTTFIASMRLLRRSITPAVAADALSEPIGVGRLWNLIDATPLVKDATSDAIDAYAAMASDAAKATLAVWKVPGIGARGGTANITATLAARLDVKSPFMQQAAEHLTANLLRQVNGETKRAVRGIIVQAMRDGTGPYETAKKIEAVIGLTERQARAVLNYRQGLTDALDRGRSLSALRGRWSLSPEIAAGRKSLSPAQVDQLTDRYADRLLKYRAYNVARTETLYAANMGQQLTFKELARDGFLDPATFRRVWSVVDDDRLCELCAPMDGQTVALDEDFESTEKGVLPSERVPLDEPQTTETPPLHPSCRCIIVTEQVEDTGGGEAPAAAPAAPLAEPEAEPETPPEAEAAPSLLDFSGASTAREVARMVGERWDVRTVGFGGANVTLDSAVAAAEAFDQMATTFPDVAEAIKEFGFSRLSSGVLGQASRWDQYLYVTNQINPETFAAAAERAYNTGFLSTPDMAGTVRHEFGHHIDYSMGKVLNGKAITAAGSMADEGKAAVWVRDALVDYYKVSAEEANKVVVEGSPMWTRVKNDLSKYATTNAKEFMAESIADASGPNPTPLARFIYERLQAIIPAAR